jgi:hypothetical protein
MKLLAQFEEILDVMLVKRQINSRTANMHKNYSAISPKRVFAAL